MLFKANCSWKISVDRFLITKLHPFFIFTIFFLPCKNLKKNTLLVSFEKIQGNCLINLWEISFKACFFLLWGRSTPLRLLSWSIVAPYSFFALLKNDTIRSNYPNSIWRVYQSGTTFRMKLITCFGREAQWALIQKSARLVMEHHAFAKYRFQSLIHKIDNYLFAISLLFLDRQRWQGLWLVIDSSTEVLKPCLFRFISLHMLMGSCANLCKYFSHIFFLFIVFF